MRPLLLKMQYFGPFINEEVDFTHLSKSQLFLICGKTGSGKTMIFDAMVYALFGKTSTESREEVDLRSHFADPKLPTKVEFEFEIKNEQYSVVRTVKYIKEGNKNPTNATVEVYKKINDKWSLETKSINTSNDYLKALLHMNVKQFRQILILPQGEFKQFLVSNSTDKRSILRTLFDSNRFESLQEQLELEMKKEIALIESHYQKITQYLNDMHDFDDEALQEHKQVEGYRYEVIQDALTSYEAVGQEKLKELTNLKAKQQQQVSEIENVFEQEKALKGNFETLQVKEAELNQLKSEEKEINDLKKQVKYLKSVQSLTYQYHQLKDKETNHTNELKNDEVLQKQISDNAQQLESIVQQINNLHKEHKQIEEYRAFVQNTKHIKVNIDKYIEAEQNLVKHKEKQKALNNAIEEDKKETEQLNSKLGHITYDEKDEQNQLKEQETMKLTLQGLETTQKLYADKQALEEKIQAYNRQLVEYENEKTSLEQRIDAEKAFDILNVEDEILKIQKHVHKGEDCPICGSIIETINGDVDFESLKQEKAKQLEVEQQLQEVNQHITTYKERINLTNEQLNKLSNVYDVQKDIASLNESVEQIVSKLKTYQENRQHIQRLEKEINAVDKQITEHTLQLNDLNHKISTYENDLAYFNKETGYTEVSSFVERVNTLEQTLSKFDQSMKKLNEQQEQYQNDKQTLQMQHATVKERLSMIEEQIKSTKDYLSTEMNKHDISLYAQLDELLLQVEDIDRLEESVQQYDKKYIEVEAVVKELSKKVRDQEMPDITNTEEQLVSAKDSLNNLTKQLNQLQLKVEQNDQKSKAILNVIDKINQDLKEQEEMIDLSRIMNGKNSQKLSLENYVLIYYLNHILDNANRHFLKMTNNRYQLVRRKEKSQGLSGLEIEVFDRFSNRTRHITSLSGGETFQASLSLAIGLSNVVQQEAGAIHLESMFIDEGFGTLDAETLETALDTLVNIQMSGRLVGIISHVSELKTRIPTILNVNKNGFLSTTVFSNN
ncbi:exonuclease subunit SbcC [Mammaliicoccus sciuri]|uniref:exonuclease subunit SbcC n=1 Tax=Mammaliicoccus sciuri TaxID=1296 RepID=UPI0027FC274A|nr:exonuclease subunit SbcC [Mammaliicoccus sciuri]MDQ7130055.1 exonuclease subunit SbcC [Mammaliicoccus sciuri]